MPDNSNVWSDGSCVTDDLAEVSVAGAGVFCEESGMAWSASCWEHLDDVQLGGEVGGQGCRLFCSVLGPLRSVQKAEVLAVSYPEGGRVGLYPLSEMETCSRT